VSHVILFGEMADLVKSQISNVKSQISNTQCQVHEAGTLENAIKMAARVARSDDVVLLSPGGTSYDAFKDFAERGDRFAQYVSALE